MDGYLIKENKTFILISNAHFHVKHACLIITPDVQHAILIIIKKVYPGIFG